MIKKDLRKIYKEKRINLRAAEKNKLEDLILIRFQQLDIEIRPNIMTFASIDKYNEFEPRLITDYCFFKNPAQSLFYPVINTGEDKMYCVQVNGQTEFNTNKFGIDEPVDGLIILPEELDIILVPLLCFDHKGYRVGYGKGYYDRFLKECRKDVIKIGFSFFEPVPEIADIKEHDIKLDYCITPFKTFHF